MPLPPPLLQRRDHAHGRPPPPEPVPPAQQPLRSPVRDGRTPTFPAAAPRVMRLLRRGQPASPAPQPLGSGAPAQPARSPLMTWQPRVAPHAAVHTCSWGTRSCCCGAERASASSARASASSCVQDGHAHCRRASDQLRTNFGQALGLLQQVPPRLEQRVGSRTLPAQLRDLLPPSDGVWSAATQSCLHDITHRLQLLHNARIHLRAAWSRWAQCGRPCATAGIGLTGGAILCRLSTRLALLGRCFDAEALCDSDGVCIAAALTAVCELT